MFGKRLTYPANKLGSIINGVTCLSWEHWRGAQSISPTPSICKGITVQGGDGEPGGSPAPVRPTAGTVPCLAWGRAPGGTRACPESPSVTDVTCQRKRRPAGDQPGPGSVNAAVSSGTAVDTQSGVMSILQMKELFTEIVSLMKALRRHIHWKKRACFNYAN